MLAICSPYLQSNRKWAEIAAGVEVTHKQVIIDDGELINTRKGYHRML